MAGNQSDMIIDCPPNPMGILFYGSVAFSGLALAGGATLGVAASGRELANDIFFVPVGLFGFFFGFMAGRGVILGQKRVRLARDVVLFGLRTPDRVSFNDITRISGRTRTRYAYGIRLGQYTNTTIHTVAGRRYLVNGCAWRAPQAVELLRQATGMRE